MRRDDPAYIREWQRRFRATPEGKEDNRRRAVECRRRARAEVLAAYGGCCVCCGETTSEFLTIDHVNNDGSKHRTEIGGSNQNSHTLYAWLRRNRFPKEGFRLLCYNCNCGRQKSPDKRCPHEAASLARAC